MNQTPLTVDFENLAERLSTLGNVLRTDKHKAHAVEAGPRDILAELPDGAPSPARLPADCSEAALLLTATAALSKAVYLAYYGKAAPDTALQLIRCSVLDAGRALHRLNAKVEAAA